MLKTKTWIAIFALLLIAGIVGSLLLFNQKPEGQVVEVLQDGKCIRTIDLSQVEEPYRFVVEDASGSNTVCVEPGRICITEADCPDHVCIRRGWLSGSAEPIVCLPHKLVIQIVGTSDLDAVAQ